VREKFLGFLLLMLIGASPIGNMVKQSSAEDWIYADGSGVHVITDFYKADSNSTGELSYKFLNGTEIASGFKYALRDSLTKTNPIVNPGFESGSGTTVYNWTVEPGAGQIVTRDSGDKHGGSYSLRFVTTGENKYTRVRSDKIYVSTKDVLYGLRFYARSNVTASVKSQVWLTTYSATNSELRNLLIKVVSSYSTSWTEYRLEASGRLTNKEAYFRVVILVQDLGVKMDLRFDDVLLEKWSMTETVNSGEVATSFTKLSPNDAVITNSFTLGGVQVERKYYVTQTSPLIKAEVTLTYPITDSIAEEYLRFVINKKSGWVTLAENYSFVDMTQESTPLWHAPKYNRNFADKWTQKIALFNNSFAFVGADSSWGWFFEPHPSLDKTIVDYVIDSIYVHMYFNRVTYPYMADINHSFTYHNGETKTFFVYFSVGQPINKDTFPIVMRQPYGYLASWTVTDHADTDDIRRMKTLMFGNESLDAPVNGSGFAGLRLPITLSVFPYSTSVTGEPPGLNNATWLSLIRELYAKGMEIAPHCVTNSELMITNASTNSRLITMDEFSSETWIDHGSIFVNMHMYGWNSSNPNNYYILPQLQDHGYKYSWDFSYYDSGLNLYDLEQYQHIGGNPPFIIILRPHSQVPWLWEFSATTSGSTISWMPSRLTELTSPTRLSTLISQRGIAITHQYLTNPAMDLYNIKTINGSFYISDALASNLNFLYQKVYSTREIWVAPIEEILDYLLKLQGLEVLPDFTTANTYKITTSQDISGLTFNFLSNIESATIDNYGVIGIKDTRLWLPTLKAGTHTLQVKFGPTSLVIPRIYDADERTVFGYCSRDKLALNISSLFGEQSITHVYLGDKGEPRAVNTSGGSLSWNYDASTRLLELRLAHLGSAEIIIDWRTPGDVNGDGRVDSSDLNALSQAFGSFPSASNWNQDCDFNYDNLVSISDLYAIGKNYNEPP